MLFLPRLNWLFYFDLIYAFILIFYFTSPISCFDVTLIIRAPVFNRLKLSLPLCISLHSVARLLVFNMHSSRTLSFCLFSVFWGIFRSTSPFLLHCTLFVQSRYVIFTGMHNASLDLTLFPKIVGKGKDWDRWLGGLILGFPPTFLG